jgi:hypothetical protein
MSVRDIGERYLVREEEWIDEYSNGLSEWLLGMMK